jgi:hypothetical protein
MLVCAVMMLAPLLALVPSASSDHVIIDNPDYTDTVQWNLDEPEDYLLTDVTVSDGRATLVWLTESGINTTGADFASGYLTNIDVVSQPGSFILDERTTFTNAITIEPDDATGWDTFINEDRETDNYGGDKDLRLDSEIGKVLRPLLRFDLGGIPTTAVVNSAILRLYEMSGGKGNDVTFSIHSLEVPFSEDLATWVRPSASEFWTTPGGDYSPEVYYKGTYDNTVGWRSLDITTLVECWVKGYLDNNGMIFVPEEVGGDALKLFASADETGSPQYRPRLMVNYTIQGSEGVYESGLIGPGTMANFTTASWSNGTLSLLDDEFSGTSLSSKWTWWNNPLIGGGGYNVGITTPGWLRVTGESNTQNLDTTIDSNFVYQNVVGDFTATTSLREFFTFNSMDAGMLVVDSNTSWLSISKSDTGVNGKIRVIACEDGVSETKANIAWPDMNTAQLKIVRDSTGLWLYVSTDGVGWTYVYQHAPDLVMRQRIKVGLFLASGSASQPVAEFDFFRVKPLAAPGVQFMVKTGNSSSLSDPSWTDWSAALPGDSIALDVDAKYLRYRVYMSTPAEWYTPIFHEFSAGWERYAETGVVESHDFTPTDFSIWLTLHAEHDDSNGRIDYYYSVDAGTTWEFSTSGTTGSIYSIQPSIRIQAVITSFDTLTTPSIDSFSIIFGTSLSTFYIETPSEVVAGEYFEVDVWAKNSKNETMSFWVGMVSMQAMNAAGTAPATDDLETPTAMITSGGHLQLTTQRYYAAETIRILVASDDRTGLSDAIVVRPASVASIDIAPEGLETVVEGTETTLHATAVDAHGNEVPDAEFTWTITSGLGSLSAYVGDSVVFTAGDHYRSGYINVTTGLVSVSIHITVEAIGHPPAFLTPVPTQTVQEDGPTWTFDLGPHVFDPDDGDEGLRWYVTNETLVTASNENRTGDLMLMLTPNPDMYGNNTLNLFIVDPDGVYSQTTVVVEVAPVNDGPTIDAIWPLVVHHDTAYTYNLRYYITDIDNDQSDLQLYVDSASTPYVDVNNEALAIVITYPEALIGSMQSIVLTVSDGDLEGSTVIAVTVSTDNVPVLLESLPDVMLYQGEAMLGAFDLDDHFMDPDEDVLYYVTGQNRVFVNITDGLVNFYAPIDWSGEEYVIFSAKDPEGARVEDAIVVTVMRVNQPPWIEDVPDLAVKYDLPYEFDLTRYIGDGDDAIGSLTISTDDPHIAVIGTVLSLRYPESMNGTTLPVDISVSDGEYSDSWVINVTVSDNAPPESLGAPDHTFTEDWPIPYPPSSGLDTWFLDEEDGTDLEFDAFSWSPDVSVNPVVDPVDSWTLRFTTTPNYHGESKVTIRAIDSEGAIVEDTIVLTVVSSPDAPTFDIQRYFNVIVGVEAAFDLSCCVYDPDTESMQLKLNVSEEYRDYITASATLVRVLFPESYLSPDENSRTIEVTLRVVDPEGMWDTSVMTITINRPAVLQAIPQWGLFIFLLTVGTSVGLFGMVMSMRKKPFVIRDMMLIHEDGFLISRHIAASTEELDEDIFTGMLTAVLNFVEDSMSSTQEQLRFFGFEHYRVMIRRGNKLYAAIVFEGDRPTDIEEKLKTFLGKVDKIYRKSLRQWTGDIDVDFAGAHLLIKAFVEENSKRSKGKDKSEGALMKRQNGATVPESEVEAPEVQSEQEPPPPPPPSPAATAVRELERSSSYLVEGDRSETAYDLFTSTLKKGMKGYCITRNYPDKIRSRFDLEDVPIVWLSDVGKDNAIRPKDLEKLSLAIDQFLSQADGGIVLLDGLEYLITNNNFNTVLRLIQSLRDQVAIKKSILLMAVDGSTLESHQLNLLEKEVDHTITG